MRYLRPYVGQMLAAAVMLAVAGAMMTLVVATLKPMVNEVLLAKPTVADTSTTQSEEPDFLEKLVDRLPVEQASEIEAMLTSSETTLITYPGIGHLPALEAPDETARDIRAYLDAAEAGAD